VKCRFCGAPLEHVFCDLGMSPIANSYVSEERLDQMEPFYPLKALVCSKCLLVQLEEFETPREIFSDQYAYFSSYSSSWLEHARRYTDMAMERFGLGSESRVVEVASNDGYLLRWFAERDVPVLGIEPTANTAEAAEEQGVSTLVEFFGRETAGRVAETGKADLLIGNNVLAHVPDLNDFVAGLKMLLAPGGTITIEFPHLLRLIAEHEWDTIYHEHYSYFSWLTAGRVLAHHGLRLFDVEELPTHGGSLRIFACHEEDFEGQSDRARELTEREERAGLHELDTYLGFQPRVRHHKWSILEFLIEEKRGGARLAAYGAPAKGNTLLNYCGVGTDLLEFTVDLNPAKQGRYLPGTRIPIRSPDHLPEERPDVVLILPWNLREEISSQLAFVRDWGGRLAVPAPEPRVLE
jgi:2-polyprenyl-3-methyl-5-hydroxy-6-metoxy-1,4-benzoquinol methylase